jgi:hypothetical protein
MNNKYIGFQIQIVRTTRLLETASIENEKPTHLFLCICIPLKQEIISFVPSINSYKFIVLLIS